MWWTKRRRAEVPETEVTGHLSPEDMIARGEQYATFDDLEGLPLTELKRVADLCSENYPDLDACVPCRAFALAWDLGEEHGTEEILLSNYQEQPIADQIAKKVQELSLLVSTALEGPPIPPRDVSSDELAVLIVGSQRWLQQIDSQRSMGFILTPEQVEFRNLVESTVNRMSSRG